MIANNDGIGGGGTGYYYDPSQPFNYLDNPINYQDDNIIDNGINISNIGSPPPPDNFRAIAHTTPRGNTEDMQHGYNGDPTGILPTYLVGEPDDFLFQVMTNLFHSCTLFDNDLSLVGDDMIRKFQNKSGGQYSNPILNSKVSESSALINFLKKFGNDLNQSLQGTGGNIDNIPTISLQYRPVFNGLHNKFYGLQILINDTEYTNVDLNSFTINTTGDWSAVVTVTIHDHFGLDKPDALNYQNYHQGFPSWWLLQHTRNYTPFETIVTVTKKVSGHM